MIAIIDYDAGNTRSVMNALDRLEVNYLLTDDHEAILGSEKVIFPGVGHAYAAMNKLIEKDLVNIIKKCSQPFLGICLGMQLLYNHSEEGDTPCIGIIDEPIREFNLDNKLKVPHMGWNSNYKNIENALMPSNDPSETYFVHSYYAPVNENSITVCEYGIKFCSAVSKDNYYGVQFHPEKSGVVGENILKNFLTL